MFVRKKAKTFKWPVLMHEPADGGTFAESTFTCTFNRLTKSQFKKLADSSDEQLIAALVVGWEGVCDEAEKPIPFTPAALAEMSDDRYWSDAVLQAYMATFEQAQAKNLKTPQDGGQPEVNAK